MDKLNIISFNDDNHAERLFVNGKFIGTLVDIEDIFENFLEVYNSMNTKIDNIRYTSIWTCDDFDEFDDESEVVDNIWDWFNTVQTMTLEQIQCIENKDWNKLNEII